MTDHSARRLIVHIGTSKTATTALQRYFHFNREALAEAGILYPSVSAGAMNGHYNFAHELAGTDRYREKRGNIRALEEEIRSSQADTVLLSSESFANYGRGAPTVAKLKAFADRIESRSRIVVYLRRQSSFAASVYAQRVKTGITTEKFDYFSKTSSKLKIFDYAALLKPWEKAFDDIVVRRFPPDGDRPIEEDFFGAAGLPGLAAALPHPLQRVNERISAKALEYVRRFSQIVAPQCANPQQLVRLLASMQRKVEKQGENDSVFQPLTEEFARRLDENFAAGNRSIAERYFGTGELFDGDLVPGGDVNLYEIRDFEECHAFMKLAMKCLEQEIALAQEKAEV